MTGLVIEGVIVARSGVRICDHPETELTLIAVSNGDRPPTFDRRKRCLRCHQVVAGIPDRKELS